MDTPITSVLRRLAFFPASELPENSRAIARLSLLDWAACAIAGRNQPVAENLGRLLDAEGGNGVAHAIGGRRLPPRAAAMLNGAASHALDYDDTHFAHIGHLSVGIYAAALAVGEEKGKNLGEVIDAFLLGAESAIRVGLALGREHYDKGFHQTATSGAFGATVAAARLYGLTADQFNNAIGLCATRASGLRNQFGTMGKPLNAGYSSSTGVECAALASLGMTSTEDGLIGKAGFVETHGGVGNADQNAAHRFIFDQISFKFHACCHGTHAMLQALRSIQAKTNIDPAQVVNLTVRVNPRWLNVCDLRAPRTGLEVKFSYVWLAGMAVHGKSTADPTAYTDDLANDPVLSGFAERVNVIGDPSLSDMQAEVVLRLSNGEETRAFHDLAMPGELARVRDELKDKAKVLVGPRAEALDRIVFGVGERPASELGKFLCKADADPTR